MKQLLLMTTLFLNLSTFAQAASHHDILNWDDVLPVSEESLLQDLRAAVFQDYTFEDEGVQCGGEIIAPALLDYYTFETYQGEISSVVKLIFQTTASDNYCVDEIVLDCVATIEIDTDDNYELTKWNCQ